MFYFYANTFLTLLIGNMFIYAMIIYARAVTGSDSVTGLVYAGNLIPPLIFGLYAGTVIDRYKRKRVIMIAQTTFIYTGAAMTYLTFQQAFRVEGFMLIAVMLVNGLGLSFIIPARMALLGDLFETKYIPRESMKIQIMIMVAFGIAPMMVGLLRKYLDWYIIFSIIGMLYASSTLLLIPVKTLPKPTPLRESAWQSLVHGFRYIKTEPLILSLLFATFVGLFLVGPLQVLLPEYAKSRLHLSEAERGSMMTMLGVGLIIGGALAQFLSHRMPRGIMIILGAGASGGAMLLIPVFDSAIPLALTLAAAGVFGGLMSALIPAAIQQSTADASRGRVMSLYNIVFQTSVASAAVVLAYWAKNSSLESAFRAAGGFILSGVCFSLLLRPLRRLK